MKLKILSPFCVALQPMSRVRRLIVEFCITQFHTHTHTHKHKHTHVHTNGDIQLDTNNLTHTMKQT
jgi:hypothetical protein